jgi:hypothetical protein
MHGRYLYLHLYHTVQSAKPTNAKPSLQMGRYFAIPAKRPASWSVSRIQICGATRASRSLCNCAVELCTFAASEKAPSQLAIEFYRP